MVFKILINLSKNAEREKKKIKMKKGKKTWNLFLRKQFDDPIKYFYGFDIDMGL